MKRLALNTEDFNELVLKFSVKASVTAIITEQPDLHLHNDIVRVCGRPRERESKSVYLSVQQPLNDKSGMKSESRFDAPSVL